jgi:hypothetical protein
MDDRESESRTSQTGQFTASTLMQGLGLTPDPWQVEAGRGPPRPHNPV